MPDEPYSLLATIGPEWVDEDFIAQGIAELEHLLWKHARFGVFLEENGL